MNLQWIAACAAVVIVLLAASPFINEETPGPIVPHSATSPELADSPAAQGVDATQASGSSGQMVAGASDVSEWSRAKSESMQAVGAISEASAQTASEVWEATKSASSKAWGATKSGAQDVAKATTMTTSGAWQATKSGATQAAGTTAESANAAWQATKSATQGWWSDLKSSTMGEARASGHQGSDSPDGAHTANQN